MDIAFIIWLVTGLAIWAFTDPISEEENWFIRKATVSYILIPVMLYGTFLTLVDFLDYLLGREVHCAGKIKSFKDFTDYVVEMWAEFFADVRKCWNGETLA
ncbi:MAG: hypothetical protein JJ891_06910 [Rhizobiaceae bacterium]|nr:hypothetical protein [Rhizobiaceae bacterium]